MAIYQPLFKALNEAGVRYVIVGGLATVLHGYARFTADIDMIIDLEHDEAEKCIKTLINLGMQSRLPIDPKEFLDVTRRKTWRKEKNMVVFSMHHPNDPLLSVDIFIHNPIDFNELYSNARMVTIDQQTIKIAEIQDLIKLKQLSNRPQDQQDIEHLLEILENNEKK